MECRHAFRAAPLSSVTLECVPTLQARDWKDYLDEINHGGRERTLVMSLGDGPVDDECRRAPYHHFSFNHAE